MTPQVTVVKIGHAMMEAFQRRHNLDVQAIKFIVDYSKVVVNGVIVGNFSSQVVDASSFKRI